VADIYAHVLFFTDNEFICYTTAVAIPNTALRKCCAAYQR